MQSSTLPPPTDEREKPDRVQTKGGEAPDAGRAADAAPDCDPTKEACAAREDELLDEGLEETFPASDPVSAKHIT